MTKTILRLDRASSSVNGNPAFWITFTDGERARTSSDSGFCYRVGNPDMREGCEVEVQYTAAGRIRSMHPAVK